MKIRTGLSVGAVCILSGILSFVPNLVEGQKVDKCGISIATAKLYAAHPELQYQIEKATSGLEAETQLKMQGQNQQQDACSDVKVIPVVFHVIHENGPENISDQTVFDAIKVLNDDYRMWNEDTADVIPAFKSIIGEALIEFRLAKIDPFGNATNGIDRVQSAETNVGDDGSKLNPWPRSKYLNIWVVKTNPQGAAAYAYLPGSVSSGFGATRDGIITRYIYVGEGERTLTHEVGHWMNLLHVWGSGNDAGNTSNCSGDDNVGDTPNCIGTLGGCDVTRNTCSSLDNVQNFMDYASCEMMFTAGQVSRMRAALSSSTAQRNQLSTTANLIATGVYESAAQFSADLVEVCAGSTVGFLDESYNGICAWAWSFPGGIPDTSNEQFPSVIYSNPGTYDVTLSVSNDTGSTEIIVTDYITVTGSETLPYSEDFSGGSDWLTSGSGGPGWEYSSFTYDGSPGCMALSNFSQGSIGDIDEMVSPSLDMSVLQSGQITFEVAYAQVNVTTNDIMRVYTSGDCGNTWSSSWISGGASLGAPNGQLTSNFTPGGTADWKSITVNLTPSMLTEFFRFKFHFTSDEGNNIYVDNINITGTYNSVPLLVSPSNFSEDQPMVVTMDWNAVADVDFYDYRIDTVYTMDSPFLITGSTNYISSSDNGSDTEYLIAGLDSGMSVYWSVRTRAGTDTSAWSSIWKYTTTPVVPVGVEEMGDLVKSLMIYPNPSTGNVTIGFDLDEFQSNVHVHIFDVLGRELIMPSNLLNNLSAGHHELKLNTIQHAGVYYIQLNVNGSSFYSRFTITK